MSWSASLRRDILTKAGYYRSGISQETHAAHWDFTAHFRLNFPHDQCVSQSTLLNFYGSNSFKHNKSLNDTNDAISSVVIDLNTQYL